MALLLRLLSHVRKRAMSVWRSLLVVRLPYCLIPKITLSRNRTRAHILTITIDPAIATTRDPARSLTLALTLAPTVTLTLTPTFAVTPTLTLASLSYSDAYSYDYR